MPELKTLGSMDSIFEGKEPETAPEADKDMSREDKPEMNCISKAYESLGEFDQRNPNATKNCTILLSDACLVGTASYVALTQGPAILIGGPLGLAALITGTGFIENSSKAEGEQATQIEGALSQPYNPQPPTTTPPVTPRGR